MRNKLQRVMEDVQQKVNRMQQAKAALMERHNQWLAKNDCAALYSHPAQAWRVERILKFTKEIQGKVLDVGCFVGILSERIVQQGGKELIGMDRLEKALELAAARGIQTALADLDEAVFDFPDNHFDCVVAGEVLDYVFDPDAVLEEIYRVLKPGGKLIISVPNLASFGNRLLVLLGWHPFGQEVRPRQGGYWRYFTFATLRALLCDHRFNIKTMESSVFIWPLIRFSFGRWPWIQKFFKPKPEWQRHRIFFSKSLAKLFPRLGENIIVLAEKPILILLNVVSLHLRELYL
ncbi:MAG: methyltransferase domain-containing protein [bacterium]